MDAITKQIAYPNFIEINEELDKVYANVSCYISSSQIMLREHSSKLDFVWPDLNYFRLV